MCWHLERALIQRVGSSPPPLAQGAQVGLAWNRFFPTSDLRAFVAQVSRCLRGKLPYFCVLATRLKALDCTILTSFFSRKKNFGARALIES